MTLSSKMINKKLNKNKNGCKAPTKLNSSMCGGPGGGHAAFQEVMNANKLDGGCNAQIETGRRHGLPERSIYYLLSCRDLSVLFH